MAIRNTIAIAAAGLLTACTTPALCTQPAAAILGDANQCDLAPAQRAPDAPRTARRACPTAYYSLPRTYVTVTVTPDDGALGPTSSPSEASCVRVLQTFREKVFGLIAKDAANGALLNEADALVRRNSTTVGTLDAESTKLEAAARDAVTDRGLLEGYGEYYRSFCLGASSIKIETTVRYDGTRLAIEGPQDILSNDHLVLGLTGGGLSKVDLKTTDRSAEIVNASAQTLFALTGYRPTFAIPSGMPSPDRSLSNLSHTEEINFLGRLTGGDDEKKAAFDRLKAAVVALEAARIKDPPTLNAALPSTSQILSTTDLVATAVSIWPGMELKLTCPDFATTDAVEVGRIGGVWGARPSTCTAVLAQIPADGGAPIEYGRSSFAAFDGRSVEPFAVDRTRFAGRETVYEFTNGQMTSSDVTTHSPVETVLKLPFTIISGVSDALTSGFTKSEAEIKAETALVTQQNSLLAAQTSLSNAQETARAAAAARVQAAQTPAVVPAAPVTVAISVAPGASASSGAAGAQSASAAQVVKAADNTQGAQVQEN